MLRKIASSGVRPGSRANLSMLAKGSGKTSSALSMFPKREYFGVMDKLKKTINIPMKHLKSFFEPDGINYVSVLPATNNMHGNTAMNFNAYITGNSYDMQNWHEMENVVHTQFGTVDNPVLIFTSDSSWRIVICMGPGSEDDSHTHEKMFYFLREGPMNRCHLCGQCFKLVRLKDEYSETNDYYTMMFAKQRIFEVSEEDMTFAMTTIFSDRPHPYFQNVPGGHVYVQVNSDEADRMLVDPAYRLTKIEEAHEKAFAIHQAYREVDRQMNELYESIPIPYGRDMYETWWKIEKAILKFDRWFNKVEKFEARKFVDPENHERREQRMLERKGKRQIENYTYFFGGLTEEEQMYRDYYETDNELDPDNELIYERLDEQQIAADGDFKLDRFDFVETALLFEPHENFESRIEKMIFTYKYRVASEDPKVFEDRQNRVVTRFLERARHRDPKIEQSVHEVLQKYEKNSSVASLMLGDPAYWTDSATEETRPLREYILNEAIQQYKDYYEDDPKVAKTFEYIDNLPNRDKIRFMEIFEDFTLINNSNALYATIPKREYNPELSYFSNLVLDLVDFKDRVRPIARDITLRDESSKYQRLSVKQRDENEKKLRELIGAEGYTYGKMDAHKKSEYNKIENMRQEEEKKFEEEHEKNVELYFKESDLPAESHAEEEPHHETLPVKSTQKIEGNAEKKEKKNLAHSQRLLELLNENVSDDIKKARLGEIKKIAEDLSKKDDQDKKQ